MNKWVIPYVDQEISFWEAITNDFGDYIEEVYFPLPVEIVASGRPKQPANFLQNFLNNISLPKSIVLNPIILSAPIDETAPKILETLKHYQERFGVTRVTVTNPQLAERIKETLPGFMITASTLMGISSPNQVEIVKDFVDSITPDTRVVRDLAALRRLRDVYSGQLRLLVNESCLGGCPYRIQHFYEMAYSPYFPASLCSKILEEKPWLRLTSGWILPQHLHFYEGLYDTLKLSGRVTLQNPKKYRYVLNAYIRRIPLFPSEIGGGPASLVDTVDISENFFSYILQCGKNCGQCTICEKYYQTAVSRT